MNTLTQNQVKNLVAGTLLLSGVLTGIMLNAQPVKAQIGSGTCTSDEVAPNPSISSNGAVLSGNWRTYSNDHNNRTATAFISQKHSGYYVLTNEEDDTADAFICGDRIVAPQWKIDGRLENNNQVINWSNGTIWKRS